MINSTFIFVTANMLGIATAMLSIDAQANNNIYLESPMVSIPAGSYYMGSDRGASDEQPVREVHIQAFQLGKYEVTFAEFKKFADDTDFDMDNICYQYVLGGPNRKVFGSWDNNIYNLGDYHPVVCVTVDTAKDYAAWLSDKTGKNYRLPTEAEWEYAARAGTNTKFHFGTEKDANKACQFGNFSDWYAADKSSEIYEGANVIDIEKCSDNEALSSMVGLYEPNQFGVYDMLGNVQEYLQDCYQNSYDGAPIDGSAVIVEECKEIVVRGGSWHWFPYSSSQRYALPIKENIGALEGFRLVLDTNGESKPASTGTKSFVEALIKAQKSTIAAHKKNAKYPSVPEGLKVLSRSTEQIKLRWQTNPEQWVTGYKVYRQDPLTNETINISGVVKMTQFIDKKPLSHNARYFVVAINNQTESQPSNSVDSNFETVHLLPALVQGEAYTFADKPELRLSGIEPEDDKLYLSLYDRYVEYIVQSPQLQTYSIEARVFHSGGEQELKIWLGDRLLAKKTIEGKRGWKTLAGIEISLPRGKSVLRMKAKNDLFGINWLNVKKVET